MALWFGVMTFLKKSRNANQTNFFHRLFLRLPPFLLLSEWVAFNLVIISLMTILLSACATTPNETGTLEGHVTIGPLVPVVRVGEAEPTPAPEVYAAREIVIFAEDGRAEVARAKIDATGNYRVTLPMGKYVVDINHLGIDFAKGLPQTVEITSQQVTRLDVEIDTGIR